MFTAHEETMVVLALRQILLDFTINFWLIFHSFLVSNLAENQLYLKIFRTVITNHVSSEPSDFLLMLLNYKLKLVLAWLNEEG